MKTIRYRFTGNEVRIPSLVRRFFMLLVMGGFAFGSQCAATLIAEWDFSSPTASVGPNLTALGDATFSGGLGLMTNTPNSRFQADPSTALNNMTNSFTLWARVRFDVDSSQAGIIDKFNNGGALNYGWEALATRAGASSQMQFYDSTSGAKASFSSSGLFNLGQFYDLAWVVNAETNGLGGAGTGIRLFVNGTLVSATVPVSITLTANSVPLSLGGWADGSSGRLSGAFDGVRIFDTAFSDAEVALLSAPEPSAAALFGLGVLLIRIHHRRSRSRGVAL
jgi:hypothetical protein